VLKFFLDSQFKDPIRIFIVDLFRIIIPLSWLSRNFLDNKNEDYKWKKFLKKET